MKGSLRRGLVGALALTMVLALSACGNKDDDLPPPDGLGNLVAGDTQQPTDPNTTVPAPNFGGTAEGDGTDQQGGSDGLQFDLQAPGDNNFDDVPLLSDDAQPTKLYTIDGDYAYELDPDTLTPVGDPLDPVTHAPVVIADQPEEEEPPVDVPPIEEDDPTPEPPVVEGDPYLVEPVVIETDDTPVVEPDPPAEEEPPVDIPSDQKLPNTGIFLEDD